MESLGSFSLILGLFIIYLMYKFVQCINPKFRGGGEDDEDLKTQKIFDYYERQKQQKEDFFKRRY